MFWPVVSWFGLVIAMVVGLSCCMLRPTREQWRVWCSGLRVGLVFSLFPFFFWLLSFVSFILFSLLLR